MSDGALKVPSVVPASQAALLRASDVHKEFYDAGRGVVVLHGLNLEVSAGEQIAIIGQSGVGKSTLLYLLGSLERPTAGKVYFEDQDLFVMDERALAEFRNRKLGFVFQFHYLLADFSALSSPYFKLARVFRGGRYAWLPAATSRFMFLLFEKRE